MVLVGISKKKGEYNGKQYENIKLNFTYETSNCEGLAVFSAKVAKPDYRYFNLDDLVIGDDYRVITDKYNQVIDVKHV